MGKWQNKKLWTGQISLRSPYIGPKCWRPSTNLENTWNLVREEVLACRRGNEQNKKLFSGENTSKKPVTRFVEPLQHHLRPPKIDWNCFGRHHWWRLYQNKKLWTGQISLRSPKLNQKCWIWSTEFEPTWDFLREEFWCARGNLTLLRNFFWRNKNYKKLKIWVIKACQGSDLGYQGLLLLKLGTYSGYLGHTRVIQGSFGLSTAQTSLICAHQSSLEVKGHYGSFGTSSWLNSRTQMPHWEPSGLDSSHGALY